MMADTMDALGLQGKYVVKVNNRKVLDGAMEAVGLGGPENASRRLNAMRAIDKMDRLGAVGVRDLLGGGRKDESGDFTTGVGLSDIAITQLLEIFSPAPLVGPLDGRVPADHFIDDDERRPFGTASEGVVINDYLLSEWETQTLSKSRTGMEGIAELRTMASLFRAAGYGTRRIRIDGSVVRGLEYYTGPVFEIELTFQVPNEKGQSVVFGSVGGGGRYDGLVSRFRSEPVPATGFSIGVSRLANALKMTGLLDAEQQSGPVVILVLDRDADAIADYQKMTSELRQAGIRAEMYLGSSGMNAQMKYADRRNAAAAVIVGSNERAEGRVTIKDLAAGAEAAKAIKDNAEYKAAKVGQSVVARADLVAELSKIPAIARMRAAG